MSVRVALCLFILGSLTCPSAEAAEEPNEIKWAEPSKDCLRTVDGEFLYSELCAVCHGAAGDGDGPAAKLLVSAPPDLTRLAFDNDGVFPSRRVLDQVSGKYHQDYGFNPMPIWARTLGNTAMSSPDPAARLRAYNLTQYLKQLQVAAVDPR